MVEALESLRAALAGRIARPLEDASARRAAVIVPIFERQGQAHLIFMRRSERLNRHAGQISFPGGSYEEADGTLLRTALREMEEEVGIRVATVQVLGGLDDVHTVASNYVITPFVGVVPEPGGYVTNFEVEEVLEVPLPVLLGQRAAPGLGPRGPYYHWRHHIIWGATARILHQFLALFP